MEELHSNYGDLAFLSPFLDVTEINYHSIGIEFPGTAVDCDNPIVTMQILTFAAIGKFQAMGS